MSASCSNGELVVDIRGKTLQSSTVSELKSRIKTAMCSRHTEYTSKDTATVELVRQVPTMVLYSTTGLELFARITECEEYYLTVAETDILHQHSQHIVGEHVDDGQMLVELGCGSMAKTRLVLDAVTRANLQVTYVAVDLSRDSLEAALGPLAVQYPDTCFVGLLGTYRTIPLLMQTTQSHMSLPCIQQKPRTSG